MIQNVVLRDPQVPPASPTPVFMFTRDLARKRIRPPVVGDEKGSGPDERWFSNVASERTIVAVFEVKKETPDEDAY
jgi:hypothetical protein